MDSDNFDDGDDDDERRRDQSSGSRPLPRRRCGVAGTLLLSVVLFLALYILRDVDDETPWWWSSLSSSESSLRNITTTTPTMNSSILVVPSDETTTTKRTADGKPAYNAPNNANGDDNNNNNNNSNNNNNEEEEEEDAKLMAALRHKLRPRPLRLLPVPLHDDQGDSNRMSSPRQLVPQQFLHLHHMKTGGTSMDGLIRCGIQRLQQQQVDDSSEHLSFAYTSIHECGYQQYQRCVSGIDIACAERIRTAAIMSYCAPLRDLSTPAFAWNTNKNKNVTNHHVANTNHDVTNTNNKNDKAAIDQNHDDQKVVVEDERAAITVLRHPVGRVWSMFRFQTRSCYGCRPLLDVYRDIDAGTNTTLTENCRMQLLNHQTRNLLAEPNDFPTGADQAAAAIRNLEQFFTMVGLTDNMTATATMVQHVFPWLAEDLDWEKAIQNADHNDGATSSKTKSTSTTTKCLMGHQNASPQNNHCLDNGKKHWALPDTPDDETIQAIIDHNDIDLLVYKAAVQLFARQQRALGLVVG
jgi:hypothetical protein